MDEAWKNRVLFLDVLRVAATIGVIVTHVTALMLYRYENLDRTEWWIAMILNASVRWCVPIFIMISGMLILGSEKEEPIFPFLKKRMRRVVPQLITWSFIYILWDNRDTIKAHEGLDWSVLFRIALGGPIKFHLWFVYLIIGLYFLAPILRVFMKNDVKQYYTKYFLILWVVAASILPFIDSMWDYKVGIHFHNMRYYIGYFVLGLYLHRANHRPDLIYKLAFLSLIITIVGSYHIMVENDGTFLKYFITYMSPTVILMSMGVFVWARERDWEALFKRFPLLGKNVLAFSSVSYGVYLMHILVLEFMESEYTPKIINGYSHGIVIGVALTVGICTIVCYIGCYAVSRVRYLRSLFI